MSAALPGLLAVAGLALAMRAVVLWRSAGPAEERLRRDTALPASSVRVPLADRLLDRYADRLGPRVARGLDPTRRAWIDRRLDLAGRPGGVTVERYVGQLAVYAVAGIGLLLALSVVGAGIVGLPVAVLAVLGPHIVLSRQGRLRQERIQRDLPDFLDVLSVTVRAGLAYDNALSRVARSISGPVSEEVRKTLRQMEVGATRREAMLALRERNDSDSLRTFVTDQLQADELGTPIAEALNALAEEIRATARQDARRRAQQAAPRVSLIVTTVIVPASILLILAALFFSADVGGTGVLG